MQTRYHQKTIVSNRHFIKNVQFTSCVLPLERKIMFRIAFIIGLILTAFSLSVTASPQSQPAKNEKNADDNYLKIAKQIITRYDQNDDKQLNAEEWQKMLLSPAKADANQDQQITVDEYARWARSKDRSKKTPATTAQKTKSKVSDAAIKPTPSKKTKTQPKPAPENQKELN